MRRSATMRRLGRSEVWGWPLFWFMGAMYAWLSLWTDCILLNSWSPFWILIAVTSFAIAVGIAALFKILFLDRLLKKHQSGLVSFIVAGFIGSIKNLAVGFMAFELGLIADPQWAFRWLGGFIIGTALFSLFSISIGARVEHTIIMAELNRVQAWLIGLRKDSAEKLADARELLATQTRQALLPKLQSLQLLFDSTGASSDTIESLRKVIGKHVRPLSEELNQRAQALAFTPAAKLMRPREVKFFQREVQLKGLIRIGSIFAILPIANLSMGYLLLSAPECLDVFYFTVVGVFAIWVAKLLIPKAIRISRGKAAAILAGLSVVASVPAYLATAQYATDMVVMLLAGVVVINFVVTTLAFAWPAGLDEDRVEARSRLDRVNQDLRLELSLFDQQLWLARRQWQFVVHGTVQSALTAALTRLQGSQSEDHATMQMVRNDLSRAEQALLRPPAHVIDLPESLSELQAVWRGIVGIKINITERAERALKVNNDACICLNEIIKEAVSNAVRHGQAKNVTVEVDRESEQSLSIKVANDGLPIKQRPAAGLGSQLIKELTTSWSLGSSKASGLTVLAASLPLAK